MSKLIRLSDRDIEALKKIQGLGPVSSAAQPVDYKDRVVVKPWGYEFLVFQNEHVAVWRLRLEKGQSTSMHCHPKKKTSLIVLSGQALCNTFFNRNYLNGLDGVIIDAGVFHSTQALSQGGCDIIEVETPPAKLDLVRLDDQYGRSGKGYEGLSQMKTDNLTHYNYFYFNEPSSGGKHFFHGQGYEISIVHIAERTDWGLRFGMNRGEFYCPCRGGIVESSGSAIAGIGDVVEGSFIGTFETQAIKEDTTLLCFKAK